VPLAAFATVDAGQMHLRAMVATPDGSAWPAPKSRRCAMPKRWAAGGRAAAAQDAEDILSSCLSEAAQAEADARSATLAAPAPDA
jgi:hydroxymethylbilane synthase